MLSLYVVEIQEPCVGGFTGFETNYHVVIAANTEIEAIGLALHADPIASKDWVTSVIKLPDPNTLEKSGILDAYC